MGAPRNLDLKYRLGLKAIGIGPDDPIYKAMQMFLPLVGLAKIKEVTLTCASEESYIKALDALEVDNNQRYAGSLLKRVMRIEFADVAINLEAPPESKEKPSSKSRQAWKELLR